MNLLFSYQNAINFPNFLADLLWKLCMLPCMTLKRHGSLQTCAIVWEVRCKVVSGLCITLKCNIIHGENKFEMDKIVPVLCLVAMQH